MNSFNKTSPLPKLKVGIVGVGHLGEFHLQKYLLHPAVTVSGIVETRPERAKEIFKKYKIPIFTSVSELIPEIEAASIAVPTSEHFTVATELTSNGIHILVEKPFTKTVEQAEQLLQLSRQEGTLIQVGHIERFNPALTILFEKKIPLAPRFIESHRLSGFTRRSTDISVVSDLLIHDIDLVLTLANSPVISVDAVGISIISVEPDLANARLTFANGCVANLNASRLSIKPMRKMRVFQEDFYISINFLKGISEIYSLEKNPGLKKSLRFPLDEKRSIYYSKLKPQKSDALALEIDTFVQAVINRRPPLVSGEQGLQALKIAAMIEKKIQDNLKNTPSSLSSFS